jgi:hypothetical protein
MKGKNKPTGRKLLRPTLACFKSAITNGSALLENTDHRSAAMRRLRDLIADHVTDLGGQDALSSAEMALIRRASMMILQLELMESKWQENNGEASPRQLEVYQRVSGGLRRLLETLGIQRRPRDVSRRKDFRHLIESARVAP